MTYSLQSYFREFDRSLSPEFHHEMVSPAMLDETFLDIQTILGDVDAIKKGLFYGRKSERLERLRCHDRRDDIDWPVKLADGLHAGLGLLTEAGELFEIIWNVILSGEETETSRAEIKDEAGDLLWYLSLLLKDQGLTLEEVAEHNIDKLRKRYPGKFDAQRAIHRPGE